MQTVNVDIAIVGAGGGGLRAAIAAAEANPNLRFILCVAIRLQQKVVRPQ